MLAVCPVERVFRPMLPILSEQEIASVLEQTSIPWRHSKQLLFCTRSISVGIYQMMMSIT